jgi:hypothetical protein
MVISSSCLEDKRFELNLALLTAHGAFEPLS